MVLSYFSPDRKPKLSRFFWLAHTCQLSLEKNVWKYFLLETNFKKEKKTLEKKIGKKKCLENKICGKNFCLKTNLSGSIFTVPAK